MGVTSSKPKQPAPAKKTPQPAFTPGVFMQHYTPFQPLPQTHQFESLPIGRPHAPAEPPVLQATAGVFALGALHGAINSRQPTVAGRIGDGVVSGGVEAGMMHFNSPYAAQQAERLRTAVLGPRPPVSFGPPANVREQLLKAVAKSSG